MLEETHSLLESDHYNSNSNSTSNSNNNNNHKNSEKSYNEKSFLSTIKYYFRQPKTWDWIVGGLIICAVIATIILIV